MKTTASITEVEEAFAAFKAAADADPGLEPEYGKKLWAVLQMLALNDKDLKQAYTNAEKWWSVRAIKKIDGCTFENREAKMKERIYGSSAWTKATKNDQGRAKAERWLAEAFRGQANDSNRA